MKRDLDLERRILIALEEDQSDPLGWVSLEFDGYSEIQVSYQIKLLAEDGYVHAIDCSSKDGTNWKAQSLTASGHRYLDAIRDDAIFAKVKANVAELGGSVPIDVVIELATTYLKQKLGLAA